jgi:O-antigen ligase
VANFREEAGGLDQKQFSFYLLLAGSAALYLLDPFVRISSKNVLPSDVFFVASGMFLLLSYKNFLHFESEILNFSGTKPFVIFAMAATLGLLISDLRHSVSLTFHFASVAQLLFSFVLLGPLIFVHKTDLRKAQVLWNVHLCLIPFAGLLSLTDFIGLTSLGEEVGERHYNAILDSNFVNGFWLFGLVSPFLLQKMFPFRLATFFYGALWIFGIAGTILAGTRAAVVVAAVSVVFIAWLNRKDIVRNNRTFASFVLFAFITVGGGIQMLQAFPVVLGRFQQTRDFFQSGQDDYSASLRQDQIKIVFRDLESKPLTWLGSGLKQYRIVHPEDEIESIHNMYLQELYESGLVGLLAFLMIFMGPLLKCATCYRLARSLGKNELSTHWACCAFAVIAYMILGLVYPVGYYRHFWLLLFLATPSSLESIPLRNAANVQSALSRSLA